ncbi:NAD(P)/FAD-dependent oxidoreductase [Methanobacterium spitsbergense]|uniref:NAD(P)/FAD-dependent oxidoreductase n=1 Tax=Methanobacterium spitsbergense TaxID=2874285 RepID=A0A8T5URK9_9EURY|nr:NAD(P)/FAD-dependent oxidoreductase [Methanobacterium spitsbergense]MBZ2164606.1 NAD(P)/FAD-dependent oxidoreductase [Methanobacterium spitsbergense]
MLNKQENQKTAIIIGAGPAGLTAAYELLDKTDIKPIIYEKSNDIGGISKTINYKGNRIDIGGHRFFSKSERVIDWWMNILPLQGAPAKDDLAVGREIPISNESIKHDIGSVKTKTFPAPDPEKIDEVMLNRSRLSRIFFLRKFFNYPISLNYNTFANLGIKRTVKIGLSYIKTSFSQIKPEKSLEDFFINRFGVELYRTFFKDYTEKVWGVSCIQITAEWGSQRIKGLSITNAIFHAFKKRFTRDSSISQKNVETSLIGQFMYPKHGPGQLWEEVAKLIIENGGEIHHGNKVVGIESKENELDAIKVLDEFTGEFKRIGGDYFLSTMPVKDLINSFEKKLPYDVSEVAQGLMYRDFIIAGLLLNELKIKNETKMITVNDLVPDNWIYIQERDVKIGRLQIFNNWSPYLVKDDSKVWIGLEYFCNEGDEMWNMSNENFTDFAIKELEKIDIINADEVIDSVVIKVQKTYPAYFGTYKKFDIIKNFTNQFENLFLIGRNGMHRYNNMDHSMLTAMTAVENIKNDIKSKENIWNINAEEEYHEEK